MIVPMKKATLLVSAREQDNALKRLRRLGVVHIHQPNVPVSDDISHIESQIAAVERCLTIFGKEPNAKPEKEFDLRAAESTVQQTLALLDQRTKLAAEFDVEKEKRGWFQNWGNISKSDLELLKQKGIFVRLYTADKSFAKKLPPEKNIYVVGQDKTRAYLALISGDESEKLDLKEDFPPAEDLRSVEDRFYSIERELLRINDEINELSKSRQLTVNYHFYLQKRLEFAKVRTGMGNIESVCYLEGFCPTDTVSALKDVADAEGWGYIFDDPDDPAIVPTLIRRPKWLNMVEPVFKFMGTIPGYAELDIGFWFLGFFSLFFAILIGDAGYGTVFLIAGILLRRKYKNAPKEPFLLLYVLSGALIFWGAITGTWFGFEQIARLPFFKSLIIEKVSAWSNNPDAVTNFLMYFTFLIGAVHLSLGHFLHGLKKLPSLQFLAQIGWMFIVWGMFFLAGTLVLNKALPSVALWGIGVGTALVGCFDNYEKGHFWRGFGATIGNLPLSVIGSFGDVVSYVRLFAVGLAGSVVESSFNSMATSGVDNFFNAIIAIIVLIFGHSLNMALGAMSVIVHGIRLNMLEFSSHLGMTWTGKAYQPFSEGTFRKKE
ncbi:MAG: hypothetical protein WC703_07095 [Candidatus Neomarinimicrobiota bacterium]